MPDDNRSLPSSRINRTKVLHVDIPESIYWHIRHCAIESRLSMKAFVTELGRTAFPLKNNAEESNQDSANEQQISRARAA